MLMQLVVTYRDYLAKTEASKIKELNEDYEESHEELVKLVETKSSLFYFQTLQINPISIILTLNMDGVNREDLNRLVGFGRTFCNIDSAHFELAGLMTKNILTNIEQLNTIVTTHYTRAAMAKLANFIVGAEILGSPVSFVSNLGTGVHDFIAEPAQGFSRSPAEFGVGVAKGTTSLVKNTTIGIFNTTSKFTGAVASGAATLSFDQKYQLERDQSRVKEKPKHVGQGFRFGAKSFGKGLLKGITGTVTAPIQGAKEDGVAGAMKGVARGAAGVIIKPTVGAIDSVSKITEGIKNTAMLWDEEKQRARLPRYIGADKAIQVFDLKKAKGQELLRTLNDGSFAKEWFQSYERVQGGTLLTTNKRILYLEEDSDITWNAPVSLIRGLQLTTEYIVVYLTEANKSKFLQRSSCAKYIYPHKGNNSLSLQQIYNNLTSFVGLLRNDRRLKNS